MSKLKRLMCRYEYNEKRIRLLNVALTVGGLNPDYKLRFERMLRRYISLRTKLKLRIVSAGGKEQQP